MLVNTEGRHSTGRPDSESNTASNAGRPRGAPECRRRSGGPSPGLGEGGDAEIPVLYWRPKSKQKEEIATDAGR